MEITRIKSRAKELGISIPNTNGLTKQELVRSIQMAEGHEPCFREPRKQCDETRCSWRDDCLPVV